MEKNKYFEEFVFNSTRLTQSILNMTLFSQLKKTEQEYSTKSFIKSFFAIIKITNLYYYKYFDLHDYLEKAKRKIRSCNDLDSLLEKIQEIFEKILLNNIMINYGLLKEKKIKVILQSNADKMKNDFFKLSLDKNYVSIFKLKYGHYSTNEYELSSPRYAEYTDKDLVALANILCKKQKLLNEHKVTYKKFIRNKTKELLPIYIYMREELKSLNLLYFFKLKKILYKNHGKCIFDNDIQYFMKEK